MTAPTPDDLPSREATSIQLIEHLMGYVSNGSQTSIQLGQDDSTKYFNVAVLYYNRVEKFYGRDLHSALFLAVFGE
jgi:hypothetical protein|tara:strand:+ start:4254 stop:4481 length:228 start_codon:yes stop_codon:yes gene_type:complete